MSQLGEEINRVSETTTFNGKNIRMVPVVLRAYR